MNARLDLQDLKIRKNLHLIEVDNRLVKPHASYTLTSSEGVAFWKYLKSVKFPLRFVYNISRCVKDRDRKISGLKIHDCYVLLHRLLSIGVQPYLLKNVYIVVTELCSFFHDLCARTIKVSNLDQLQSDIIIILYKLKRIFSPTFFDIMHLVVHLPYDTRVAGPISYRLMYSIERSLRILKYFFLNKARFEGFIAEAYVMSESMTFCSTYLNGIETWFTRDEQNDDNIPYDEVIDEFEVFLQKVRLSNPTSGIYLLGPSHGVKPIDIVHFKNDINPTLGRTI